jgi:hypothetical protein
MRVGLGRAKITADVQHKAFLRHFKQLGHGGDVSTFSDLFSGEALPRIE